MPLYDFRCRDCSAEREVRAPIERVTALTLICTACGGTMSKAVSRTIAFLAGPGSSASPSPDPLSGSAKRGHTCSDGVVKLTRSNPFAPDLPARVSASGESD